MRSFVLIICLTLGVLCKGELNWTTKVVNLESGIGQEVVFADFEYKNEGNQDIHIRSVKPSCGCAVVHFEEEAICPDGTGVIKVKIDIKNKKGLLGYMLTVVSEVDDKDCIDELSVKITVPELISINPRVLISKRTNGKETLSTTITINKEVELEIEDLNIEASDPIGLNYRYQQVGHKKYRLDFFNVEIDDGEVVKIYLIGNERYNSILRKYPIYIKR